MLAPTFDALQAVKTLAFQQTPVNIVGTYKGMIFSERIQPLKVGQDYVIFRAPCLQVCLTLRDPVYLYSRMLPETVRARPHLLNCNTHELRLSDFSYTGSLWFERGEQRIQPESPALAELILNGQRYSATLKDLSVHGAGLFIDQTPGNELDVCINTPVELYLNLGPSLQMTIPASISQRRKVGKVLLMVGLRLRPSPTQETWLNSYISDRKIDIYNELEQQIRLRLEPQMASTPFF